MTTLAEFSSQPQETHLSPQALDKLKDLKKSLGRDTQKLDHHLKNALLYLRTSAEEINERGSTERVRQNKKLKRLAKDNEEQSEDERLAHQVFQNNVETTTQKLDHATRAIIDNQIWLEDVPVSLDQVSKKLAGPGTGTSTQSQTQTPTPTQTQRTDEINDPASTSPPEPEANATSLLDSIQSASEHKWTSQSLTARYASNNDYIDFYRTVFHAKHPGEDQPPLPHASTWFAQTETQTQAHSPADTADQSESDIEVSAERIRLTCPITLRLFEEPLKSTKCPHAFEKKYILDWLGKSTERVELTDEQRSELSQLGQAERNRREKNMRVPVIRCPECQVRISSKDLRPDPVLVRMVKRERERLRKEEEQARDDYTMHEDDDDHGPIGTQRRVVHLGSSPARRSSGMHRNVKAERNSIVPQTQFSTLDDENEDTNMDMDS